MYAYLNWKLGLFKNVWSTESQSSFISSVPFKATKNSYRDSDAVFHKDAIHSRHKFWNMGKISSFTEV